MFKTCLFLVVIAGRARTRAKKVRMRRRSDGVVRCIFGVGAVDDGEW